MAGIGSSSNSRGGYDYQFVKTPDDFLSCAICHFPSREPYLTECCGQTFCKSCLEASKKMNSACPMCRHENFVTIFNKQVDRLIRSLGVFCTNKEQGCDWQGEVQSIIDHLSKCLFQIVSCSNDCGKSLERQYLASHIETECPRRKIECQFCHDTGEYQFIEGQHKDECPKFPLPCPNKCEIESIERDRIEEHRKICPLEVIQCDYHVIGCTTRMARKELSKHKQEMMEEHLSLSINELVATKTQMQLMATGQQFTALQGKVKKTRDELNEKLSSAMASMQQAAIHKDALAATEKSLTQELAHVKKDIKATKEQLTANQLDTMETKTKLRNELAVSLTEMKDKLTKITYDSAKKTKERNDDDSAKKIKEFETKLDNLQGMFYDPTIFWYNTLNYRALKLLSYDQVAPVVVKIPEYSKIMQEWCSAPFSLKSKSSQSSHRSIKPSYRSYPSRKQLDDRSFSSQCIKVSVTLKVTIKENHISIKLRDAAGLKVVVKLLNQISDGEHYMATNKPPVSDEGTYNYYASPFQLSDDLDRYRPMDIDDDVSFFIPFKELTKITNTCRFLNNDVIFLEVLPHEDD